jgi:hypothetical protein
MTSVLLVVDAQQNMLLPPEPVPDAATISQAIECTLRDAQPAVDVAASVEAELADAGVQITEAADLTF